MSSFETAREDPWRSALSQGDPDAAWDLFMGQYRRLIFATIRHYARDHDLAMDVFADVCGALRENALAKLERYWDRAVHQARFSSWLVTVVRHLAVDSLRHHLGRMRRSVRADLSPLQQRIFELLFLDGRSHLETFEVVRQTLAPALPFRDFARELAATYRSVIGKHIATTLARELAAPAPVDVAEIPAEELEDPAALLDTRLRIASMLESLAPEERLAIELFVVDDMPAAAVARTLGWPNAKTVYNRVYRALAALRTRLERQGIRRADL